MATRLGAAATLALVLGVGATAKARAEPEISGSSSAHSTEAQPKTSSKTRPAAVSSAPSADREPTLPSLQVQLEAPLAKGPWVLRVVNAGTAPVRLLADARLIALYLTPRSARSAIHCELPSDMLPADPYERAIVVPPERAWVTAFAPELYCFSPKAVDALTSGTIVVARLGWPGAGSRKGASGPAAASPLGGGPASPIARTVESSPIALPDDVIAPAQPDAGPDDLSDAPRLSLAGPPMVDATGPSAVEVPLTLRNEGNRPAIVRFRPEMLSLTIQRGTRVTHCGWPTLPGAATRESFTTIAPQASVELTILLSAYCGAAVLGSSGLFGARVNFDARASGGASIGLRAFDGSLIEKAPTRIRLHRGSEPEPLVRPALW